MLMLFPKLTGVFLPEGLPASVAEHESRIGVAPGHAGRIGNDAQSS
jgi:hypothetical protein